MDKSKIGLDIDGILAYFTKGFYEWFNEPFIEPTKWEDEFIVKNFKKIVNVNEFWLNLPVLTHPEHIDFDVECYITARPCPSYISYKWLTKNGFPARPVFTVGSTGSKHNTKTEIIRELGITHFVDDHSVHVIDINSNTDCTCFIMTQPHNQWMDLEPRINGLNELKMYL